MWRERALGLIDSFGFKGFSRNQYWAGVSHQSSLYTERGMCFRSLAVFISLSAIRKGVALALGVYGWM
jgi:hypothetical protein